MADAIGIDLGGTKIEGQVFDADWSCVARRRVETPATYDDLIRALTDMAGWAGRKAGREGLPMGVSAPGVVDPETGQVFAANLAATGRRLPADLRSRLGDGLEYLGDGQAFALSEARVGAGQGHARVFGLVLGTGLGAGLVAWEGDSGSESEIGHLPLPATAVAKHGLPLAPCGCGRTGCFETVLAGAGISALHKSRTGDIQTPKGLASAARKGAPGALKTLSIWRDILADLIVMVQTIVSPDAVVIGGGLSGLLDGPQPLSEETDAKLLPGVRLADIALAAGGPDSGARGAAIAATMARSVV